MSFGSNLKISQFLKSFRIHAADVIAHISASVQVASLQFQTRTRSPKQSTMSRNRRGVVLSDDEGTAPPPSRLSNGRSVSRTQTSRTPASRTSAAASEAPIILDRVAKLTPEDLDKIRILDRENRALRGLIMNAVSIISDTAVAVEELNVSGEHAEVLCG
jgi:hypothetical protein